MTLIRSGKREGRKRIHNTKVSKDSSINKSIEGLLRRMKIDREGKQKEKRDLVDLIGRRGFFLSLASSLLSWLLWHRREHGRPTQGRALYHDPLMTLKHAGSRCSASYWGE